jgi:dTDP-4-amino-4,6-dideoxygalactose transaminase
LEQREIGYNYWLSELECALGRVQLGRVAGILEMRRAAAQRYDSLLQNIPHVELPPLALPRRTISWFVYVVRLTSETARDRAQAHLAGKGIAPGATSPRFICSLHGNSPRNVLNSGGQKESRALRSLSLYLIELLLSSKRMLFRLCAMQSSLIERLQQDEVPAVLLE